MKNLSICVAVLSLNLSAFAHPGGLDASGGHHDRKNGGYHYHRAPAARHSTDGNAIRPYAEPPPQRMIVRPAAAVNQMREVAPVIAAKKEAGGPPQSALGPEFNERKRVLEYQIQRAAKGDARAQYAMGVRYLQGIDVPQDELKALEYLNASRSSGHVQARERLLEIQRAKKKSEVDAQNRRESQFLSGGNATLMDTQQK